MRRLAAFVLVGIVLAAPIARGDAIEARWFDERARAAFARHRYEEALSLFLQVRAASESDGTLYNVGVSAELAGHPDVAYAYFEDFLRAGTDDATQRADAEQRMHGLEARLALVRIESDPPGATVWVDRRELGAWGHTPRTLAIDPGAHTIELTLDGHVGDRVEVTSVRGATTQVARTLAEEHGALRVSVVPGDARVVAIDARGAEHALGAETSLTVGAYHLRAERDGHRSEERDVVVGAGAPSTVTLTLAAVPPRTGRLLATTRGVRATVLVDGTAVAETPLTLDTIAEGRHDVVIRADGFVSWTGTVDVVADRSAFVDVTLVPTRP